MMKETSHKESPFKFLDSYGKADRDIFFGRDTEIEELYERVFESNLILLYGPSGTGKTSLVQCGLANQFDDRDWLPLFIRREEQILESLNKVLRKAAHRSLSPDMSLPQKVRSLYLDFYKPVYLVFDQFEELFVLGSEDEQIQFFESLKVLLASELQCKILLCIRGEYLDKLSKFELVIPSLFDNRMYLERMSRRNLQDVIHFSADSFGIELADKEKTIKLIIDNITDPKGMVELTNMQIYLDKLYRKDIERRGNTNRPIRFDQELLDNTRQLEDVLSDFLEEQIQTLETELAALGIAQKGLPLDLLFALVTEDGTKKSVETGLIKNLLQKKKGINPEIVDYCLKQFEKLKIVRLMSNDQG